MNEYVPDGFVVLDENEDEDLKGSEKKKKEFSRLRKNRGDMLLVEDDIALVHENVAAAAETSSRPIKKVKKVYANEIGPERVNKSERLTSDNEFSDEVEEDEGDEMDDFLVDDLGGESEGDGDEPRARAPRRRQQAYADGPAQEELDEAFDIFGEGYEDYLSGGEDDDEGNEAAEDSDDDIFAEGMKIREKKRQSSQATKLKPSSGTSIFERSKLVENFCTEHDDVLRNIDLPERFIGVMSGRTPPDRTERREEAKWIAISLTDKIIMEYGGLSEIPSHFGYRSEYRLEDSLVEAIDFVLSMLQIDKYEVPFIWTYRKDYLHNLFTRKHLWFIYSMDIKWEDLVGRRNDLLLELQAVASVAEGNIKVSGSGKYQSLDSLLICICSIVVIGGNS